MPQSGYINSRLAHCVSISGGHTSESYRLLFPFECHPCTEGLWWEIDHTRSCWRTVSWNIDDPHYDKLEVEAGSGPADDSTDEEAQDPGSFAAGESDESDGFITAFQAISLEAPRERREKQFFDSFCVTNDVKSARSILNQSENPRDLIDGNCFPEDKPILLAVCEEGHLEVVSFLLEHSPLLEATNDSGETALTAAISYGYGRIALMLVQAGACTNTINNDGKPLLDLSKQALQRHEEFRRLELHGMYANCITTQSRLRKRELEISALQDIIEECELQERKRLAEGKRQRLVELHGEYQANHFIETEAFDQAEIINEMLRKIIRTPRSSDWKTIACLSRGTALPYILAVSGYSDGQFGSLDGALNRPTWTQKVFQLAKLVGHEMPQDQRDEKDYPGSFYACHAEKQVLTFALWNHTTKLGDVDEEAQLDGCEPPLKQLQVEIFIRQPARDRSFICPDCAAFCSKVAENFDISLRLFLVHTLVTELAFSWN